MWNTDSFCTNRAMLIFILKHDIILIRQGSRQTKLQFQMKVWGIHYTPACMFPGGRGATFYNPNPSVIGYNYWGDERGSKYPQLFLAVHTQAVPELRKDVVSSRAWLQAHRCWWRSSDLGEWSKKTGWQKMPLTTSSMQMLQQSS